MLNNKVGVTPQLIFLIVLFSSLNAWTHEFNQEKWKLTEATIELSTIKTKEVRSDSLFGVLVKEENQTLDQITEDDGESILIFQIRYKAPIKLKRDKNFREQLIVQRGLFQTLNPAIKNAIFKKTYPLAIEIIYEINNPVNIKYLSDKEIIDFSVLLTNSIDDKWQPKG